MKKKKRLLREGKLRERCQEPLHFTCNACGEPFSQADWQNNSGICPACMDGSPTGCAICAMCQAPQAGLNYDPQTPGDTDPRPCHSITIFEKTGKVVFDPSGESDGHEIPPKKPEPLPVLPEKEHPLKPGPKPSPSPYQPFYIDIVVTCIGVAVCLFFAGFGIPTDGLRDPSLAYAAGIAVLTAFLALKLCRSRFKPGKKKPGNVRTSLLLAVLVLVTSFYSLQQHTDLLLPEFILYTSLAACASYSLTRLAFKRLSILLALASTLIAGYLLATNHWVSPSGASPSGASPSGTSNFLAPTDVSSTSEAPQAADSSAGTVADTTESSSPAIHSREVFVTRAGQDFAIIDGEFHPLDLRYEIQVDPKLDPLIRPQRDIFQDYEESLKLLLNTRTKAELAANYREFLAWRKEYSRIENTLTVLVDEKFKTLSSGAGAERQLDYKVIGHVLKSGRAYRLKIDTIIEKYRHWHRQSIETSAQTFAPDLPWDELRSDFKTQLTRVQNNLKKFPRRL